MLSRSLSSKALVVYWAHIWLQFTRYNSKALTQVWYCPVSIRFALLFYCPQKCILYFSGFYVNVIHISEVFVWMCFITSLYLIRIGGFKKPTNIHEEIDNFPSAPCNWLRLTAQWFISSSYRGRTLPKLFQCYDVTRWDQSEKRIVFDAVLPKKLDVDKV